MKILTFCAYYTPEIAASMYLTTNMFEDWAALGADIEVFVPTPTRGVDAAVVEKYKKIKKEVFCDGRLVVHRFPLMQEGKGTVGRALRYGLLNLMFFYYGLRTKADVMFIDSTPPTQGVVAALLKKIKKIPMVYNLQDIFPDSLIHTGICKKDSVFVKIGSWMEQVTYRNSDKIIVISEDFKKNIMEKGVPQEKISVVYNWVDENAVQYCPRNENTLFDEYKLDRGKYYIAYSGNIGLTQNMDMLLEVAQRIRQRKDICFVLIGDGAYRETVESIISERQLDNVKLLPFQPYDRISEVFSLGDIGLIISKGGVGNNSVPSKTWSYMSARRPIMASFDLESELCSIIRKTDCGICVAADDADAFEAAILAAADNSIEEKGNLGRQFVLEHLTRSIGTKAYFDVLCEAEKIN